MKLSKYLKDKLFFLLSFFFLYLIIVLLLFAFKSPNSLIIAISFLLFLFAFLVLFVDYVRKKSFYDELLSHIQKLDKSYLVLETLKTPSFYEGEILYQALYEINKSMNENVKEYEMQMTDFKEYIEMWIHEVKIPLSSLLLMTYNHKNKWDKKLIEQIRKIENYTEQVLYYVRQESSEKDYLIKENNLSNMISEVALKNQDDLLEQRIDFIVENVDYFVFTDSKWAIFILNQIINNSMKYKKEKNSYIKVSACETKDAITLTIEDNGIGIPSSDISKVFQKSFTGENGRTKGKSTGMGLFIVKSLCDKLGHKIKIESKQNKYTKVSITFFKNSYYEVVK